MLNRRDPDRALGSRLRAWSTRHLVALAAGAAFVLRLPGLLLPIRPDEAGFTLVARAWEPSADSVFGPYFVDRPPSVVAVFGLADQLGSPVAVRLLGALAAAATVVLVARTARLLANEKISRRTAVLVAALVASPLIDPASVKGELLALPFLAAAAYGALLAVRGEGRRPALLAGVAGLSGALAIGFKQNLASGLVFAVVLVCGSWLTGELLRRRALQMLGALVLGASVPVLATVGWALAAGVRLEALWYTVYGFRGDAGRVVGLCCEGAAAQRLSLLLLVALPAGILLAIGAFAIHLPHQWRRDRSVTSAVSAMLIIDLVGVAAGGSYWRDYLFPLVPGVGIAVALLMLHPPVRFHLGRWVAPLAVASTLVSMVGWGVLEAAGAIHDDAFATGKAVGTAARPGDTLVVHGGRADLQWASGLSSPYEHLWSLPMRTLDPRYDDFRQLVRGPRAPTWIVEWVSFAAWPDGERLQEAVAERYVEAGTGCADRRVHLLRGVSRPAPRPDCD